MRILYNLYTDFAAKSSCFRKLRKKFQIRNGFCGYAVKFVDARSGVDSTFIKIR